MGNSNTFSRDVRAAKSNKGVAKPKDKIIGNSSTEDWLDAFDDDLSMMGYRDYSPYRERSSIDIHTPTGMIDMSETGIPLMANGQYLPPYSGIHNMGTPYVKEERIARYGGGLDKYQTKGEVPKSDSKNYYTSDLKDYKKRLKAYNDSSIVADKATAIANEMISKAIKEGYSPAELRVTNFPYVGWPGNSSRNLKRHDPSSPISGYHINVNHHLSNDKELISRGLVKPHDGDNALTINPYQEAVFNDPDRNRTVAYPIYKKPTQQVHYVQPKPKKKPVEKKKPEVITPEDLPMIEAHMPDMISQEPDITPKFIFLKQSNVNNRIGWRMDTETRKMVPVYLEGKQKVAQGKRLYNQNIPTSTMAIPEDFEPQFDRPEIVERTDPYWRRKYVQPKTVANKKYGGWLDEYAPGGTPGRPPINRSSFPTGPGRYSSNQGYIDADRVSQNSPWFNPEAAIEEYLGYPQEYGAQAAITSKGPVDNIRHSVASYKTAKAIADKTKPYLGNYFGKAAGVIGANVLGLAHEIQKFPNQMDDVFQGGRPFWNTIKENAQDLWNNGYGAFQVFNGMTPDGTTEYLKQQSKKGNLAKGYVEDNHVLPKGERVLNDNTRVVREDGGDLKQYQGDVNGSQVVNLSNQFIYPSGFQYASNTPLQNRAQACQGPDCLAGANTYYNTYVASKFGLPTSWKMLDDYGIVSGDPNQPYGVSMDSWDAAAEMQAKGAIQNYAAPLYEADKKTRRDQAAAAKYWKEKPYDEKKKIYSQLALGTLVNFGDWGGIHGERLQGSNEKAGLYPSRHSTRVIGFTEDGTPMIYDMGQIRRIDDPRYDFPITNITTPKELAKYNYQYVKDWEATNNKKLNYNPKEKLLLTKGSQRPGEDPFTDEEFKYVEGINKNIKNLMAITGASQEDIIKAGKVAFGVMQGETKGGRSLSAKSKEFTKPVLNALAEMFTLGAADTEEASQGLTRIKPEMQAGDETNKYSQYLKTLGLDPKKLDLWDPEQAALATTALILSRKGNLEGVDKWYLRAQQHNTPSVGPKNEQRLKEADKDYASNVIKNTARLYSTNTGYGLPETEKWMTKKQSERLKQEAAQSKKEGAKIFSEALKPKVMASESTGYSPKVIPISQLAKKEMGGESGWIDEYDLPKAQVGFNNYTQPGPLATGDPRDSFGFTFPTPVEKPVIETKKPVKKQDVVKGKQQTFFPEPGKNYNGTLRATPTYIEDKQKTKGKPLTYLQKRKMAADEEFENERLYNTAKAFTTVGSFIPGPIGVASGAIGGGMNMYDKDYVPGALQWTELALAPFQNDPRVQALSGLNNLISGKELWDLGSKIQQSSPNMLDYYADDQKRELFKPSKEVMFDYQKYGGVKKYKGLPKGTTKNVVRGINKLFIPDPKLFGPFGRKTFDPNSKFEYGGWLDDLPKAQMYNSQVGVGRFGDLRPTQDNTRVFVPNLPKKPLTKAEQEEAKQYAVKQASRDLQKANEKLAKIQRIRASDKAQKEQGFPTTRQEWADQTQATGDKLSLQNLPVVGEYIPDILDVTGGIGSMASSLGSAPLRAQQEDSYMPYLNAFAAPLLQGAFAGMNTRNTGEFLNNLVNPFAGVNVKGLRRKPVPNAEFDPNHYEFSNSEMTDYFAQQPKGEAAYYDELLNKKAADKERWQQALEQARQDVRNSQYEGIELFDDNNDPFGDYTRAVNARTTNNNADNILNTPQAIRTQAIRDYIQRDTPNAEQFVTTPSSIPPPPTYEQYLDNASYIGTTPLSREQYEYINNTPTPSLQSTPQTYEEYLNNTTDAIPFSRQEYDAMGGLTPTPPLQITPPNPPRTWMGLQEPDWFRNAPGLFDTPQGSGTGPRIQATPTPKDDWADISENLKQNKKSTKAVETVKKELARDKNTTGRVNYSDVDSSDKHTLLDKSVIPSSDKLDDLINNFEEVLNHTPQDHNLRNKLVTQVEDLKSTKWLREEYAKELELQGLKPQKDLSIVTSHSGYNSLKHLVDSEGNIIASIDIDPKGYVGSSGLAHDYHGANLKRLNFEDEVAAQTALEERLKTRNLEALQNSFDRGYLDRNAFDNYKLGTESSAKKEAAETMARILRNNNNKYGEALYRGVHHGIKDTKGGLKSHKHFVHTSLKNPITDEIETAKRGKLGWTSWMKQGKAADELDPNGIEQFRMIRSLFPYLGAGYLGSKALEEQKYGGWLDSYK